MLEKSHQVSQEEKDIRFPLVASNFLQEWIKNSSRKVPLSGQRRDWLVYPNRLSWVTPSLLLRGAEHLQMKMKLWVLNFSACPFIYQQPGASNLSRVAGEGELRCGVCRERPSPGRQEWKGRQMLQAAACLQPLSAEGQDQLTQVMVHRISPLPARSVSLVLAI